MLGCSTDADCSGVTLCFKNVSWSPSGVEGGSFCACNTYYGWSGDDCLDRTRHTWILVASTSLQVTIAGLGYLYFFAFGVSHALLCQARCDVQSVTLVMVLIALAGLATWQACELGVALTPQFMEVENDEGEKLHPWTLGERIGIVFSMFFVTLALLQVSLVWLCVVESAETFQRADSDQLLAYRHVVFAFQFLWLALLIALVAIDKLKLLIFAALPLIFFIVVTYLVAGYKLYTVLLQAQGENSKSDSATLSRLRGNFDLNEEEGSLAFGSTASSYEGTVDPSSSKNGNTVGPTANADEGNVWLESTTQTHTTAATAVSHVDALFASSYEGTVDPSSSKNGNTVGPTANADEGNVWLESTTQTHTTAATAVSHVDALFGKIMIDVRKTSWRICGATMFSIAAGLLYATTSDETNLDPENIVHLAMIGAEGVPFGFLLAILFVGFYLRDNKHNVSSNATRGALRGGQYATGNTAYNSTLTAPTSSHVNATAEMPRSKLQR